MKRTRPWSHDITWYNTVTVQHELRLHKLIAEADRERLGRQASPAGQGGVWRRLRRRAGRLLVAVGAALRGPAPAAEVAPPLDCTESC
jgi:hypothetical protein